MVDGCRAAICHIAGVGNPNSTQAGWPYHVVTVHMARHSRRDIYMSKPITVSVGGLRHKTNQAIRRYIDAESFAYTSYCVVLWYWTAVCLSANWIPGTYDILLIGDPDTVWFCVFVCLPYGNVQHLFNVDHSKTFLARVLLLFQVPTSPQHERTQQYFVWFDDLAVLAFRQEDIRNA